MLNVLGIRVSVVAFLVSLAVTFPLAAYATSAARVDFAVGEVKVLAPDGRSRPLAKGAEVANGETIDTGSGRVQVRFSDGAQVSLAPQTQFRIDDYHFAGKADGSEKGFFSLLKGALRTITGLVGRSNSDKYRVTTTVATIGIRGTEFSVTYGNSINVTTGEGSNEICNAAGCLILTSGETAYVADANSRPVKTYKKAVIPPPPPQWQQLPGYIAGDSVKRDGTPAWLPSASPPSSSLTSGPGYSIAMTGYLLSVGGFSRFEGTVDGSIVSTTATFNGGGLTALGVAGPLEVTQVTPDGMLSDGIVGWGRWINATAPSWSTPFLHTHYVVGLPPPVMPTTGTASYSLLGYTNPTASLDGVSYTFGTQPILGSLTANFGGGTVAGNLSVPIGGSTYSTSWSAAPINGTIFSGYGTAVTGGGCSTREGLNKS